VKFESKTTERRFILAKPSCASPLFFRGDVLHRFDWPHFIMLCVIPTAAFLCLFVFVFYCNKVHQLLFTTYWTRNIGVGSI